MMSSTKAGARGESGFTLIDLLFVISLIGLLSTLAIPGLMRARGAAQSASALGTIKVINGAQLSFAITCGLGFYSPEFQTLGVIPPASTEAYLPPEMSSSPTFIKSGYTFSLAGVAVPGAPASCNGLPASAASSGYAAVADPLDTAPQARYFGTNADGTIYEDVASYVMTMPETGAPPGGALLK
jgi:type II secretory pathway pseudopilin PulG